MARLPVSSLPETHVSGITNSMALISQTNAPLTNVAGASDNTLTSAAVGAAGGLGVGVCLGLAPANIVGVALAAGALLCASNSSK